MGKDIYHCSCGRSFGTNLAAFILHLTKYKHKEK